MGGDDVDVTPLEPATLAHALLFSKEYVQQHGVGGIHDNHINRHYGRSISPTSKTNS